MTKPTPAPGQLDPEQITQAFANVSRAVTRLTFNLTASAALGHCLNGKPDGARVNLAKLDDEQLGQVENAARDLVALVLETRENRS